MATEKNGNWKNGNGKNGNQKIPVAQFSAAHFSGCHFFPWSFPFSLFQTTLCCPFFLPCQFLLPNFPIAQFSGSHFFRCRFFICPFFSCRFSVNRQRPSCRKTSCMLMQHTGYWSTGQTDWWTDKQTLHHSLHRRSPLEVGCVNKLHHTC